MVQPTTTQTSSAEKKYLKRLGSFISLKLKERDSRVEWLAEKTGIARSTLCEILAGRSNPRLLTVKAVAHALGYRSLADFLREAVDGR